MVPVPTGPRVTRDRSNSPNEPLAGSAAARCPRQPTSPVFAAHRRMPAQNAAVPRHLGDMVCSPRAEFGDGSALPASCLRGHFLVSPASAVRWNTIRAVTTSPATMNCWPRPLFATLPGVSAPPPFGSSQRTILVRLDPNKLRSYNMSPPQDEKLGRSSWSPVRRNRSRPQEERQEQPFARSFPRTAVRKRGDPLRLPTTPWRRPWAVGVIADTADLSASAMCPAA
jgi:hypothetical protein